MKEQSLIQENGTNKVLTQLFSIPSSNLNIVLYEHDSSPVVLSYGQKGTAYNPGLNL